MAMCVLQCFIHSFILNEGRDSEKCDESSRMLDLLLFHANNQIKLFVKCAETFKHAREMAENT